ncbi:unnamed protein product (macronuclear) [Paramecium tetraurelia]|uniref:RING-type domain-containing protein n=1 Tax=Paramecium tetraurelia TaxID=5888 RepID=A0E0X7_PARTE|nr:uncharacterized protein GSPATT00022112001 [Paramecium tetraurelia]CAK88944.1 unnamed protein product [Paramecium tetraurelia]|eukprot:XP_001456341.1 hypothetical protein (macronuclear) [Paramecium tetraurelia strain d4-2]
MFILLFFYICNAFHHQGTIQINQTLTLTTNFTEMVPSIIIKFLLDQDRNRESAVACFVSNLDLESQTFDIQNLKLNKESQIVYDLHSIQSNSNAQLIEYFYYHTIYLLCQSESGGQIDYQLTYNQDPYKAGCINDCQGYNDTKSISQSYCQIDHCECQINQVGFFCQLPSKYILSSNQENVALDSFSWIFYYYQYKNLDLQLLSDTTIDDKTVLYSLAFRDIPQKTIPDLSMSKVLNNSTSLLEELSNLQPSQYGSNILYIGLYNNKSEKAQFKITIISNDSADYGQLERNKIIIIVVGTVVGALLLVTCVLSFLKTKKLQAEQQALRLRQIRINQNNQVQLEVIRQKKQPNGFSEKFIKDYFGVIAYKKLVQLYPGLTQFEECVICLESIKHGQKKQQRNCSVTPCFHIFHQKCLTSWLEKQKNCPFCRAEFSTILIQNKYPWLDLKQQRINNSTQDDSKYIKNMKLNSNTNQSQENQLNESQQELVKKDKIILDL